MKIIFRLLLFSIPFELSGCDKDRCTGIRQDNYTSIGQLYLSPDFDPWIIPSANSLAFRNSNGGSFQFVVTNTTSMSNVELRHTGTDKCNNENIETCQMQFEDITYRCIDVPYTFGFHRELPVVNTYYGFIINKDSATKRSENIRFLVGKTSFGFDVIDTPKCFMTSYKLLDRIYYNVCVCENPKVDSGLYPVRFILQKEVGLIGFELSNKEVWVVE